MVHARVRASTGRSFDLDSCKGDDRDLLYDLYMDFLDGIQVRNNITPAPSFTIIDKFKIDCVTVFKVQSGVSRSILFHIVVECGCGVTDFFRAYDAHLSAVEAYELFLLQERL